jgi:hypothetical protein
MGLKLIAGALGALLTASMVVFADSIPDPSASSPNDIVDRYLSAVRAEQARAQDLSMEMDIDAKLPSLRRSGRLQAFKFIPRLGQIVYRIIRFEGDETVKRDVIARYLTAEKEARAKLASTMAISPDNYRFKYKGTADWLGQTAYVFQVTPREKRLGLFKGELWIDSKTYLPLREWGELVKNPSVFLRNVYFVRDYYIWEGRSIPRRIISDVSTRLVGRAQLTIWFNHYALGGPAPAALADGAEAEASHSNGGGQR